MSGDPSTDAWNAVADDWVRHADTNDYRNFFLMPRMLAMLGDPRNRRILDLGCGEGGYCRELARRGASVVGVDGSERLIEVARERTAEENVTYMCANAAATPLDSDSFDVVIAAMSLMDVEDYQGAIGESHRLLRAGGELLMSITHPCFSAPVSHWIRDDQRRLETFAVDRYFDRATWPSKVTERFAAPVLRHHRPLQDYLSAAIGAGFVLREFSEAEPTEEELKLSPRFAKIARVPYFIFMRWQK
ncbi:MAG TPA: class I SAM-dependent methyltransferase [Thermoanaerobaculia bacterium]